MEAVAPTTGQSPGIALALIRESTTNPRRHFDQAALDELTDSVRRLGVLQPILVRPAKKGYEVVSGHRRFRAAKAAGLSEIPAVVQVLDDLQVLEIQLVENLQRTDLHPLEEAEGYDALMRKGYDVHRLAAQIGRSVKYVYDRVKLLHLTHETADLFRANRITAGHAVILARLTPEQQAKAIDPQVNRYGGGGGQGLWRGEHVLLHPDEEDEDEYDPDIDDEIPPGVDPYKSLAPVSVRELQAWVDKNCRLDRHQVDGMLFPETAIAVAGAQEEKSKVIPITYDHVCPQGAKAQERTYGSSAWRRADGKPGPAQYGRKPIAATCEYSVLGVVVAGAGRGEAFDVCVVKDKCKVHWAAEQKEKAKRAKAEAAGGSLQDRWKKEDEKRRAEQAKRDAASKRFEKATPAILKAVAQAVQKEAVSSRGILGSIIVSACSDRRMPKGAAQMVPLGSSAEELIRHAAFLALAGETQAWDAYEDFPKRAKHLGIDVAAILDEHAPEPKAEASPKTKKPAKKAAKK